MDGPLQGGVQGGQHDTETSSQPGPNAPPAISLPKGGGAIRGIGEKFAANPVTGTGSMSVPIATSPGRSGFGPELSLSYDSGSGNGPFGFGWSLSLPSITRKTDKGLPQYLDAVESDTFILSGAEDLVPLNLPDGKRFEDTTSVPGYTIHRYRPRIEGLFARIERWTHQSGDVHWHSISKDNILTLYGKDDNSRIVDPNDPGCIFSWLISETRDDKGNAIIYKYKEENGVGIDLSRASERNRGERNDQRRTVNRYLKYIYYGNSEPLLNSLGHRPHHLTQDQLDNAGWMFEVVLDYGEHDADAPQPDDPGEWDCRDDAFSSYRAGFEVRTCRLCQRVLMFHHIPDLSTGEEGYDGLVRSTDFTYSYEKDPDAARNPIYSFLIAVTQRGYQRADAGGYVTKSLPPVEFEYTLPEVQDKVQEVDAKSLENLPIGLDGITYQWTDLHGEGITGILTEQAGAWLYKRNLSPISEGSVKFAPLETVASKPNLALAEGQARFMDLAGDGQPDLVVLDGPMPGFYEHDSDEGWQPYRPFTSHLNHDTRDPNLKFVDLDGDGHADVLITEDDAFVWHASLAENGFGPARRVQQVLDEEKGPHLIFADGTQSIYLADLSGDGLTDLVRIRNGEVCYWPNLGHCRFGAKVTMDKAPHFDEPDQFDNKRIRLADIDGTGTTDIIYLHRQGVHLYFNQFGNSWSAPKSLSTFPSLDDLVAITPVDLHGNDTVCLVWSSPLAADAPRQMRYVDLMGGQKPHLLVKTVNNLGAETRVHYAPSTKFYLQDKRDGRPWITQLPFPVHVVERVETYDHISRNRYVTRYSYHHGYFDGEEREFRGFSIVEQLDTEELAVLTNDATLPEPANFDAASNLPPVLTKTWFHTGVYLSTEGISLQLAKEYHGAPKPSEPDYLSKMRKYITTELLPDTVLQPEFTTEEEREACRALKGTMLRREVYALDGTDKEQHPYTVTEQNFTVRCLQPRDDNRHAVFFTHPRETINYHYERNPADPRIHHALTLEVDSFGNVLKEAAIGYGRHYTIHVTNDQGEVVEIPNPALSQLSTEDQKKQTDTLITYTKNRVAKDPDTYVIDTQHDYRTPLPAETYTYELTGIKPENKAARFGFDEWMRNDFALPTSATVIPYEQTASHSTPQKRLIEYIRICYRPNDLGASLDDNDPLALLMLGTLESLALPGETYKLAFTPGLLAQVYQRPQEEQSPETLLPDPSSVLPIDSSLGQVADRGGYVDLDGDGNWWIPAGRVFLSPNGEHNAAQERDYAHEHFFLPHRYRDPFHISDISTESLVIYDAYDLLMLETRDALDNRITAGERDPTGNQTNRGNDYRVLQPRRLMDPNRNRTEVAFDALGMVVGMAVSGKPLPAPVEDDSLDGFTADLSDSIILDQLDNPLSNPHAILGHATTRLVYDLFAYQRTKDRHNPQPAVVYTLARVTHVADLIHDQQTKIQHNFSYSDGFGREIQKKIQAEPENRNGVVGPPRWVGSGWTIYNNKGNPVRKYEPFFTDTHRFEFGLQVGVSSILFYDAVERVIATLHPNHTWEKVVFDPWQQTTYDVNDNCAPCNTQTGDPRTDLDIQGYVAEYFKTQPADWQTWHAQRSDGALGLQEQVAATRAAAHADTPTTAHFDALGHPFLTVVRNRVVCAGHNLDGTEETFTTRVELDIEGNQRAVRDAIQQAGDPLGRIVMRYDYDMLGNRIQQLSMEAGAHWMLNDVVGKTIRAWDSRGHNLTSAYDALRRPVAQTVRGTIANGDATSDPRTLNRDVLVDKIKYGEGVANSESLNLRTRIYQHFDSAGVATNARLDANGIPTEAYDFKGNLLRSTRQMVSDYTAITDWLLDPQLDDETFEGSTRYDALNRTIQSVAPHSNLPRTKLNIIQTVFNEANLLEQVDVWLERAAEPPGLLDPNAEAPSEVGVANIDYNAKGQRLRIDYKNGANTTYEYDPLTFRLTHLLTWRNGDTFPVGKEVAVATPSLLSQWG